MQIYLLQELRRVVPLRKNTEFSRDLGPGRSYTNYSQKILSTLTSCQGAAELFFERGGLTHSIMSVVDLHNSAFYFRYSSPLDAD